MAWGLRLLGLLAAVSPWLTALPAPIALPASALALAEGLRLAHRHARTPAMTLRLQAEPDLLEVDGAAMTAFRLRWRGRWVFIEWSDAAGRRRRLIVWPGQMNALHQRQLRLLQHKDAAAGTTPALQTVAP